MTHHPNLLGDPLTDILALVGIVSAPAARLELGTTGAIRFPGSLPIEYGSVMQGSCWLHLPGQAEPVRLMAGDCYMLSRGQPYTLGLGSDGLPMDAVEVNAFVARYREPDGVVRAWEGSAAQTVLVCGGFRLQANADLLLGLLPGLILLSASPSTLPLLHAALGALAQETCTNTLGSQMVTASLAQIVLVQMLRGYAASQPCRSRSGAWLGAFADERVSRALKLMHGDPLRRWTLPELADAAGMSRSSFALRFKTLVGTPPLDYLLRWRMRRAGQVLRDSDRTISSLAFEYGYTSESAFSASFKRALGCSPRHYRRHPEEASGLPGCQPPGDLAGVTSSDVLEQVPSLGDAGRSWSA
jgi:AraC-like DNA-binding protein